MLVWYHCIDHSHRQCVGRRHYLAGYHQLSGTTPADQPRQDEGSTTVGRQTDLNECLIEARAFTGDYQVTCQCKVTTTSRSGAVYRCDDRDGRVTNQHDAFIQLAQIPACTKRPPRPRKNNGAGFRSYRFLYCRLELPANSQGQCVQGLWPVKRDNTNSATHLKLNRFVVHICRRPCSFTTKRRNAVRSASQEGSFLSLCNHRVPAIQLILTRMLSDEAFTILSRGWR